MPTGGGTPGSATTNHLSDYVREYLRQHDLTERGLARRAVDPQTGFALNHGWVNQLVQARVTRAPELWRLRALAAAMGTTTRYLAELSAAQWLGLEVSEVPAEPDGTIAVSVPPGLSDEAREKLRRMVEDLARHMTD